MEQFSPTDVTGLDNELIPPGEESVKHAGKTKYIVHVLALRELNEQYFSAEVQFLFTLHFCSFILPVDFKNLYPLRY